MTASRYRRPNDLDRLGQRPMVVEASAGTGKTYLLEHLFVDLILRRGAAAEEILVVTFTEKATAELQTRVRALIEKLLALPPGVGADLPDAEAFVLDDPARERLARALRSFDAVTISTMHGFCQRVLSENAFAQARPWREEILDGAASFAAVFHEVVREALAEDGHRKRLLAAWLGREGTIDKLGTFLHELHRKKHAVLRPDWQPERLAAAVEAVRALLGQHDELVSLLKANTKNGSKKKALVEHFDQLAIAVAGITDGVSALAGIEAGLVPYILERWPEADHPLLAEGGAVLASLAQALPPIGAALAAEFLAPVAERLARQKRALGELDFDDLIAHVETALAAGTPTAAALRVALRRRYRHALIDEFQDTDHIQWSIFRRLFMECGPGRSLTVIGDPKQAIYAFRGADVYTYLDARTTIETMSGPSLHLSQNFRSTPALVAACNQVFDQAAPFFRPESGIRYDHPVVAAKDNAGLVHADDRPAAPLVLFRPEAPDDGKKLPIGKLRACVRAGMVRAIAELLSPNCPIRRVGKDDPIVPSDIYILTATKQEGLDIGHALGQVGIAHAFYKQGNLFASDEADEFLRLLRALHNPGDRALRARAMLTPFFDLPLPGVATADDGPAARRFFDLAEEARGGNIPALLGRCLEETGLLRRTIFAGDNERGLTNYLHLRELLQAEWAKGGQTLGELIDGFARLVRRAQDGEAEDTHMQRLSTDKAAVQLLTIHKAKGLEADFVFVYGGLATREKPVSFVTYHEDGQRILYLDPKDEAAKAKARIETQDEDERLLYVALTRARYRLYLAHLPDHVLPASGKLRALNRRLTAIVETAPTACELISLPLGQSLPAPIPTVPTDAVSADAETQAGLATLRPGQRGFLVTSYSAIKRAAGGFAPVEETAPPSAGLEIPHAEANDTDDLPGGPETGVFLHSLLEAMPVDRMRELAIPLESDPAIVALADRERRRAGRPEAHLLPALRLVDRAFRTPVRLGDLPLPGIAWATRHLREMEFLFPIPEASHALLGNPTGAGFAIERGLVKGFIDLLFEADGRIYVCDWKSDLLPRWDTDTLTRHCEHNYDVQARLYTLATLRWLGIRDEATYEKKLGGILYYFLRGLDPADDRRGVHFRRPAWTDVLGWEADLLAHDFGGRP